jgi:hypothetical protein
MTTPSDDWQWLVAVCRKPETQKILSNPAPAPLPKRGPVRQLLSCIRDSLGSKRSTGITSSEARRALAAGAVLELGKVTLWLQQKPCLQQHTAAQAAASKGEPDWHFFLSTLEMIVQATAAIDPSQMQIVKDCADQLTMSGQSCRSQPPSIKACLFTACSDGQKYIILMFSWDVVMLGDIHSLEP